MQEFRQPLQRGSGDLILEIILDRLDVVVGDLLDLFDLLRFLRGKAGHDCA